MQSEYKNITKAIQNAFKVKLSEKEVVYQKAICNDAGNLYMIEYNHDGVFYYGTMENHKNSYKVYIFLDEEHDTLLKKKTVELSIFDLF